MIFAVEEIEVVVAHRERATVRVDDVFLKIDSDQTPLDLQVQAMGDALSDLATLTLGHPEHLDHVIGGYGEIDQFPEAEVLLRE